MCHPALNNKGSYAVHTEITDRRSPSKMPPWKRFPFLKRGRERFRGRALYSIILWAMLSALIFQMLLPSPAPLVQEPLNRNSPFLSASSINQCANRASSWMGGNWAAPIFSRTKRACFRGQRIITRIFLSLNLVRSIQNWTEPNMLAFSCKRSILFRKKLENALARPGMLTRYLL